MTEVKTLTMEEKVDYLYNKSIEDEKRRKRRKIWLLLIFVLSIWYTYYFMLIALPSIVSWTSSNSQYQSILNKYLTK